MWKFNLKEERFTVYKVPNSVMDECITWTNRNESSFKGLVWFVCVVSDKSFFLGFFFLLFFIACFGFEGCVTCECNLCTILHCSGVVCTVRSHVYVNNSNYLSEVTEVNLTCHKENLFFVFSLCHFDIIWQIYQTVWIFEPKLME